MWISALAPTAPIAHLPPSLPDEAVVLNASKSSDEEDGWCPEEDSNLHGLAATGT